jgi:hypothetical protein
MIAMLALWASLGQGPLDAARESFRGFGKVEFEYEGTFERFDDFKPHPSLEKTYGYSGSLKFNGETPLAAWQYQRQRAGRVEISKGSATPRRARYSHRIVGMKLPINQESTFGGYVALTSIGGQFQLPNWFPTAAILVANGDDDAEFTDLGEEIRDGRKCRVVAHRVADLDEAKFWLDLDRHGLAIAKEFRRKGTLLQVVKAVDVKSYAGASGRKIWLPEMIVTEMPGRFNRATGKHEITNPSPWCRWTTTIKSETIKIDDESTMLMEVRLDGRAPVRTADNPVPQIPRAVRPPPR